MKDLMTSLSLVYLLIDSCFTLIISIHLSKTASFSNGLVKIVFKPLPIFKKLISTYFKGKFKAYHHKISSSFKILFNPHILFACLNRVNKTHSQFCASKEFNYYFFFIFLAWRSFERADASWSLLEVMGNIVLD